MVEINYKGMLVSCYGVMHEEQNIHVVCDNEIDDCVFSEGFSSWKIAVPAVIDTLLERNETIEVVEMQAQ